MLKGEFVDIEILQLRKNVISFLNNSDQSTKYIYGIFAQIKLEFLVYFNTYLNRHEVLFLRWIILVLIPSKLIGRELCLRNVVIDLS